MINAGIQSEDKIRTFRTLNIAMQLSPESNKR